MRVFLPADDIDATAGASAAGDLVGVCDVSLA